MRFEFTIFPTIHVNFHFFLVFYGAVNSQARLVPIIGSVNLLRVRRRATAGFPIQAYYDKSLQWVRADHWPPKHFLHFECC